MKRLLNLIKLWPEMWSIPAGIALWMISPYLLRMVDPVAGVFDAGVLQVLLYAVIGLLLFNGVVFGGIKANWPTVFNFYSKEFPGIFNNLTGWQKCCFLLVLYAALMLAAVILAATL